MHSKNSLLPGSTTLFKMVINQKCLWQLKPPDNFGEVSLSKDIFRHHRCNWVYSFITGLRYRWFTWNSIKISSHIDIFWQTFRKLPHLKRIGHQQKYRKYWYRICPIKSTMRVKVGKFFCSRGFVKYFYTRIPQRVPITVLRTATRNGR